MYDFIIHLLLMMMNKLTRNEVNRALNSCSPAEYERKERSLPGTGLLVDHQPPVS